MCENQRYYDQVFRGAAIGFAVGMAVRNIMAPRYPPPMLHPPPIPVIPTPMICKCENKYAMTSNLQIPSHHGVHHHRRHHSRSKSASERSKRSRERPSDNPASTTTSKKTKLSPSREKYSSKSIDNGNISKSCEKMAKTAKTVEDSPFEWQENNESPVSECETQTAHRHFDFSIDPSGPSVADNYFHQNFYNLEFPSTTSTQYLPIPFDSNYGKNESEKSNFQTNYGNSNFQTNYENSNFSINSLDDSAQTIDSIAARLGTGNQKFDHEISYPQTFLTLPTYYGTEQNLI